MYGYYAVYARRLHAQTILSLENPPLLLQRLPAATIQTQSQTEHFLSFQNEQFTNYTQITRLQILGEFSFPALLATLKHIH